MRWNRNRILASLLFIAVFCLGLVVQAPPEFVRRVMGSDAPPVLALAVPRLGAGAEGVPELAAVANETHLVWRYERFSLSRLGPVYRVNLAGPGFAARGRLAVTPFNRLLLTDLLLVSALPDVHRDLRQTAFRPLGRAVVSIDRLETALRSGRIDGLAGTVQWENARFESAPEIDLGTVTAQLSAPERGRVHAGIANRGGSVELSGTIALVMDEELVVDLYLEPKSGASGSLGRALALFTERENAGRRLRHTIPLGRDSGSAPKTAAP